MERLTSCRICLIENDLMYSVDGTNLQGTYEKLTGTPFVTNDCRPLQVCYICCARLRSCYQFQTSCLRSEQILTQMLANMQLRPTSLLHMRTIQIQHPLINISIKPADAKDSDFIVIDKNDHTSSHLDVMVDVKVEAIDSDHEVNKGCDKGSELECNVQIVEAKDNIDYENAEVIIENRIEVNDSNIKDNIRYQHCYENNKRTNVINNVTLTNNEAAEFNIDDNNVEKQDRICMDSVDNTPIKDVKVVLYKMSLNSIKTSAHVCDEPTTILKENTRRSNLRKVKNNVKFDFTENIHKDRDKIYNPWNTHRPDKKLYECDICEKRFYRKHHLIEHNRIHTGEKPYKCNICEKAFTFQNVLNNHIRIHSDEKPHKCDICDKCFNLKINLIRHIRIHTNEKPHKCSVCEKCFNCKQHLKIHMRIHTGEKPYKCDICSKCFNQKNNLNIHIRSVHTVDKSCK